MTRGRGGVTIPPKNDDVIYEQPLIWFIIIRDICVNYSISSFSFWVGANLPFNHNSSSLHLGCMQIRADDIQASFLPFAFSLHCDENIWTLQANSAANEIHRSWLEQSSIGLKMSLALWSSSCRMSFCAQACVTF